MSLTFKQQLIDKKNQLRDNLIRAEWECMNELAESIRKQIKKIEQEIEQLWKT